MKLSLLPFVLSLFTTPAFADAYLVCSSPLGGAVSVAAANNGGNYFTIRLATSDGNLQSLGLPTGQDYDLTGSFQSCESNSNFDNVAYCEAYAVDNSNISVTATGVRDHSVRTLSFQFFDLRARLEQITFMGGPRNFVAIDISMDTADKHHTNVRKSFQIPLAGQEQNQPSQCL
jgi:hypothetical protein